MNISITMIIAINSLVLAVLWFSLLIYQKTQKTYPGYGIWTTSTLIIALAYLLLIFIPKINIYWLTNFTTRFLFSLVVLLRLEGATRFLEKKSLNKVLYFIPVAFGTLSMLISIYDKHFIIEDVFRALVFCTLFLMIARVFLKHANPANPGIYRFIGSLFLIYSLIQLCYLLLSIFDSTFGLGILNNVLLIYFVFSTMFEISWGISYIMLNSQRLESDLLKSQKRLYNSVNDLEKALAEIKTLSGLLPICSSCKSIRDDKGYWNKLEAYIMKHSNAQFSHGICPECAKKLYPSPKKEDDKDSKNKE